MMDLYPAIDVLGGRCVRLRQGDYGEETVYDGDPVRVARRFAAAGARWLHVVDLDAARTGVPVNREVVVAMADAVAVGGIQVQSGGGIRSVEAAEALWSAGVARVVIGTAAVERPELVRALADRKPGGVAVGLDTRGGEVAVRGWVEGSGLGVAEVLDRLAEAGVAALIVTDISRDGMLGGPDVAGVSAVLQSAPSDVDVIASGGVASAEDLGVLAALRTADGRRLAGAIVGKALYEGRISVEEGVKVCAACG